MKLSVIVTTDNATQRLQNTLWGLARQTFTDFDVLLASSGEPGEVQQIETLLQNPIADLTVRHLKPTDQIDQTLPLNELLEKAEHDYIVLMHGDSIPRWDFLAAHQKRATKGKCLTGRYYAVPRDASHAITTEDIQWGRCFEFLWLRQNGLPATASRTPLSSGKLFARMMDAAMPAKYQPDCCHLSGWKSDLMIAVNSNTGSSIRSPAATGPMQGDAVSLQHQMSDCDVQLSRLQLGAVCLQLHP